MSHVTEPEKVFANHGTYTTQYTLVSIEASGAMWAVDERHVTGAKIFAQHRVLGSSRCRTSRRCAIVRHSILSPGSTKPFAEVAVREKTITSREVLDWWWKKQRAVEKKDTNKAHQAEEGQDDEENNEEEENGKPFDAPGKFKSKSSKLQLLLMASERTIVFLHVLPRFVETCLGPAWILRSSY